MGKFFYREDLKRMKLMIESRGQFIRLLQKELVRLADRLEATSAENKELREKLANSAEEIRQLKRNEETKKRSSKQ